MLQVVLMCIWVEKHCKLGRRISMRIIVTLTYSRSVIDRGVNVGRSRVGEIFFSRRQATVMIRSVLEPHCLVSNPTKFKLATFQLTGWHSTH